MNWSKLVQEPFQIMFSTCFVFLLGDGAGFNFTAFGECLQQMKETILNM